MIRSRIALPARLLAAALCALALVPLAAQADPRDERGRDHWPERRFRDVPHSRGTVVPRLPHSHRTIIYGGIPYYFDGGFWYRPWGGNFVVVAPPVGIVLPILPNGYVTLNIGGRVYYRHDDVYYMRRNDGYIVVDPPLQEHPDEDDEGRSTPLPRDELFIYPNRNQGERQQGNDRFECHEWAVGQTGYDPTLAGGGSGYSPAHRSDYLRALSACLEGRGYTVR